MTKLELIPFQTQAEIEDRLINEFCEHILENADLFTLDYAIHLGKTKENKDRFMILCRRCGALYENQAWRKLALDGLKDGLRANEVKNRV